METKSNKNFKNEVLWFVLALLVLFWFIFLFLKINGHFDFSSKYGIKSLWAKEGYNCQMVIDGDGNTTWGILYDEHSLGDVFKFEFVESRTITSVSIINNSEFPQPTVRILVSEDGANYTNVDYTCTEDAETSSYFYVLEYEVDTKYIEFEYNNSETGRWPITEVEFYE